MWNGSNGAIMANFYDFNEDIDTLSTNTTNFRQQSSSSTMQQPQTDPIATTTSNLTTSNTSLNAISTVNIATNSYGSIDVNSFF